MSVYEKIKSVAHFTPSERIFANYVLEHPEDVLKMSARAIAQKCFIARTSIYNGLTKLGIAGLDQLKFEMLQDMHAGIWQKSSVEEAETVHFHELDQGSLQVLTPFYQKAVQQTMSLLKMDQILRMIEQLKRTDNIYFFPLLIMIRSL